MNGLTPWKRVAALGAVAAVAFLAEAPSLVTGRETRSASLAAQGQRDTLSGPMMRRLAEAADALRDGQAHWFVIDTTPPYDVVGVYPSAAAARAAILPGLVYHGPYLTPVDFGLTGPVFVLCPHVNYPWASAYRSWLGAPGGNRICPSIPNRLPVPLRQVRGLTLVIRLVDDSVVLPINPREVDALFFNMSVFDKFVVPYYARVSGPAYAQMLRDSMEALVRQAAR